ncbi:hypothetical protein WE348_21565 (plasmid) [Alteromonas macleodii]|uniref:hypothetical protein n=1 Tax=Alteromonas macleodii TaxID=28108 RepID=UPI0030D39B91
MLKSALLSKPVKTSHPFFQRFTALFERINHLLTRIDDCIGSISEALATKYFLPMVNDLNELLSVSGVYLNGLKSHKGSQLAADNEDEITSTLELIEKAVMDISQQFNLTLNGNIEV